MSYSFLRSCCLGGVFLALLFIYFFIFEKEIRNPYLLRADSSFLTEKFTIDDEYRSPAFIFGNRDHKKVALASSSVYKLSKLLGVKNANTALKEAKLFKSQILKARLTQDWTKNCHKKHSKSLCSNVQYYFDNLKKKKNRKNKRLSVKAIPFSLKNVLKLHSQPLQYLLSKTPNYKWKMLQKKTTKALKKKKCPTNYSFSLAREVEKYLEKEKSALKLMNRLDDHGLSCLKTKELHDEYILLRIALVNIYQKNYQKAYTLLKMSDSVDNKRENYRTLYWKYWLEKKLFKDKKSPSLYKMISQYPLSWHTSLALENDRSLDPLKLITYRPLYPDTLKSQYEDINQFSYWFQLISHLDNSNYTLNKMAEVFVKVIPNDTQAGFLQHLARVFFRLSFYKMQIIITNKIRVHHPDQVNTETIRLLYPRPYYQQLLKNAADFDTAILLGVLRQESAFDQQAKSSAQAMGLMQLLPSTARTLSKNIKKKQLYDSNTNIKLGSQYLRKLINRTGQFEYAMASYNAGYSRFKGWKSQYTEDISKQLFIDLIPYRETRDYVAGIMRNAYWYHRLFPEFTRRLQKNKKITSSDTLQTLLKIDK